jgi:murein DD-endopeptidase MepM/ murein hydrolase activator NlpD
VTKTAFPVQTRLRTLAALILVFLLAFPSGKAQAQAQGPTYIVKEGDTLWGIAQVFGTDAETLASFNGLTSNSTIYPGMSLIIPGFEGVEGELQTQDVAFGDTLGSLAMRYGVPPAALARLNRVLNPSRLYLGQPIIIPVSAEAGGALARSQPVQADAGQGALSIAARLGINPWLVHAHTSTNEGLWTVPGELILLDGTTRDTTALPAAMGSVDVTPAPAVQGHTVEVTVQSSGPLWLEGQLNDKPLNFHPLDDTHMVALQGVYALLDPGLYDLELRAYTDKGGELLASYAQPVRVASGGYPFDPVLSVPPETIDPEYTGPEDQLVASVVNQVTDARSWDGPFAFPGPYTDSFPSRFGSRRNYNGTGYNYYHSGLDFYGGTGTAITAPAPGRVVFAQELTVRGNTTIIDHGWGIFTAYLHQSEIEVAVGDQVETGQTIGLVGGTGRVTGPHLHWEVWVGGVPVDPIEWTEQTFP